MPRRRVNRPVFSPVVLAHFRERLNSRLVALGWTVENIRRSVEKDVFIGEIMSNEALKQDTTHHAL